MANWIEEQCRSKGMPITSQRRLIARVLAEARDHPDVIELRRRVARLDNRVSLATVYRTLRLLAEAGIVERCAFAEGRARYEKAPTMHHDHLIDVTTGRVIEFRSVEIERLQTAIARKHGYRVVGHRLQLFAVPLRRASPGKR
jgi:Fur family ferric uptake transcriptional regulator